MSGIWLDSLPSHVPLTKKPYACLLIVSILLGKPSVIPLERVKRHMRAISSDQQWRG